MGDSFTSLALEALPEMIDAARCQEWLFRMLRPGMAVERCPFCRAPLSQKMQATFRSFRKAHCIACGKQFTATSETEFHSAKLDPKEIMITAVLVELGATPELIARLIGRGTDTARIWRDKLSGMSLPPAEVPADDSLPLP